MTSSSRCQERRWHQSSWKSRLRDYRHHDRRAGNLLLVAFLLAASVSWDQRGVGGGGGSSRVLFCRAQTPMRNPASTRSPAAPSPTTPTAPTGNETVSDAPSDVPSASPTRTTTTNAPVAPSPRPSDSPQPSSAPSEGVVPSRRPSGSPSGAPTAAATTSEPTRAPTVSPTPGDTGGQQRATLSDVVALYEGVGTVSNTTITRMLAETEAWFMNSYNNKSYTTRKLVARATTTGGTTAATTTTTTTTFGRSSTFGRSLQQDGGDSNAVNPADAGVERMRTQIRLVSRRVTSEGLQLVYNQDMQWVESDVSSSSSQSYSASELASFPYGYRPTNDVYVNILQSIPGFETVASPFPLPEFPTQPTQAPTDAPTRSPSAPPESSSPLSIGAIIGIAVGGAAFLAILLYCIATTCCAGARSDGASDKDSRVAASSSGYQSAGGAYASVGPPPTRVSTGRDEVSAMDYPKDGLESMGDYQDQSVATVDYDYSKAYGGAGDTSVVSSAGGTMGDTTRQSAGDVAAVAAARAALGASFDSDGGAGAAGGGAGGAFREDSNIKEEIIEIHAPAGKLGVVIDTPDDGAPVVHAVKDSSVIADQICVGDKLIAVDDEDVRSMTAIKVSKLISKKSANPSRKLTIVRTTYIDDP